MCHVYIEPWFNKKNVYKWAKHRFAPISLSQKDSLMEWKNTDSPVKKKFGAQLSLKKVILTVFWDMKGPITIDFLKSVQL